MDFFSKKQFNIPIFFLLMANIFPLYGVMVLKWGVFELIFLYWLENVVIGLLHVLKIILSQSASSHLGLKLFIVPFFIVHYGIFTFVHGAFIIILFSTEVLQDKLLELDYFFVYSDILMVKSMDIALLLLFVSNAVSLYFYYIKNGTYLLTSFEKLLFEPYGRIITLHIGILASGFLLLMLNQPMVGLIIVLFLKIGFDIRSIGVKSSSNSNADV